MFLWSAHFQNHQTFKFSTSLHTESRSPRPSTSAFFPACSVLPRFPHYQVVTGSQISHSPGFSLPNPTNYIFKLHLHLFHMHVCMCKCTHSSMCIYVMLGIWKLMDNFCSPFLLLCRSGLVAKKVFPLTFLADWNCYIFKSILDFPMCILLCPCMYLYHVHFWCLQRLEEGTASPKLDSQRL